MKGQKMNFKNPGQAIRAGMEDVTDEVAGGTAAMEPSLRRG